MVVTDSKLTDAVRPVFLTFAGEVEPGEPFAHMIENARLIAALAAEGARPMASNCCAEAVTGISSFKWLASASMSRSPTAKRLPRGCWSPPTARARPSARPPASQTHGWSYGQSGIVTTVAHERDHDGRAEEHFLPAGPFAILPLKGRRSSIVWTEEAREAERIVALPDDAFTTSWSAASG